MMVFRGGDVVKVLKDHAAYDTYRRLFQSIKPYWKLFLLGIVATIIGALVDASLAWMIKPVINRGFIDRDMAFIHLLPLGVVALFVVRGLTNLSSNYHISKVGRFVVRDFRQNIFNHLLKLPAKFFDEHSSGQLLSLITYNTEQVAEAATYAFITLIQEGCLFFGLLGVMFIISWQLSLLFLIMAPLIALAVKYSSLRLRKLSLNVQESMGSVAHVAEETIEGYRVVRTFGGEQYERDKFTQVINSNQRRELKMVVTDTLGSSVVQLLAAIPIALTLYLATAPGSQISAGSFAAMVAAMLSLLRPLRRLSRINTMIQKGVAGASSVFELLDQEPETDTGRLPLSRARGQIEFKDIHFRYAQSDKDVLSKINLKVQPGETVALVGRSGAGKSTIVSLLPRFYEAHSGSILIDGMDHREYRLADLRRQFALVSQRVSLFNDTIAANICYGAGRVVDEVELRHIAKVAHALEFIEQLPQGFNSIIGEDGVLLSGGQRQRIAIARALLKDAPILILDEATSALDTESERHIQAALQALMRQRTTLVIAHRLSTIEAADRICVFDHGQIVESGTHEQLLALNGQYANLYRLQFQDNSEESELAMDAVH
jgi:subfamily B ATP-binding cassette protein MsbA